MNKTLQTIKLESKIKITKSRIINSVTAIHAKCIDCQPEGNKVKNCEFTDCPLYPYRLGKNPFRGKAKPDNYLPALKAIRAECISCNYSPMEVRLCPCGDCALHPYRFAKNPFVSDAKREQGLKVAHNLKKGTKTEEN